MIWWIAICIYHEARNQPFAGQIAVGHVILNRAEQRGLTVKEIIFQPQQFSWANGGARPPIKEYEAIETAFAAVEACLKERQEGKDLCGADHYFADSIAEPSWAAKMELIAKIGNHTFYRS